MTGPDDGGVFGGFKPLPGVLLEAKTSFTLELQPPPKPRLTLQQLAQLVIDHGLDAAVTDGEPVWIDARGGRWVVRVELTDVVPTRSFVVGDLDEEPEGWEPMDEQLVYEGPMFKRAECIAALLTDPMTCLALANGQPPNLGGLPWVAIAPAGHMLSACTDPETPKDPSR